MRWTVILAAAVLAPTLIAQSVAGGFVIETVVNPVSNGRAMAFAPDGRMFYTENATGQIMVVDNPTTTPSAPTVFATVSGFVAPSGNDLGLHGIVLHPSFPIAPGDATNRFVYVCHTTGTAGAPQLVIKRFTEDTAALGTALTGSETTITSSIDMGSAGGNFGGRLAFGPDGMLYASVGDGGSAVNLAGGFAQDTTDRRGKILRYLPDGSIPLNNPISGNPMFARGFRNPRAIAFNTTTGDAFSVDRGNPATTGADELNVVSADGNYGWSSAGGSGNLTNPAFANPAWVLADSFEPSSVAFYPTSATAFPSVGYRGAVAYVGSEAAAGAIHRVVLTGSNERTGVVAWPLASGFSSAVRDLKFGPDGNLYVMTDGVIYRIRFAGNTSPNDPVANAGTDQVVDEGKAVNLTGANSFDADVSDVLRFTWRQVGGGSVVVLTNPTTATPSFTAPGVGFTQNYTFELIVEDGNGGVANDFVIVTVNNTGNSDGSDKEPLFEAPGEGGCAAAAGAGWALLVLIPGVVWIRRRLTCRAAADRQAS